jgi:transposase
MAPLARRTWAPRGGTPELVQKSGTREKVSVLAALCLSPRRDRLDLYSQTLANGYFDTWHVASFLEAMVQGLVGRFVVIWDGGSMHKGDPINQLVRESQGRLDLERLPAHAPVLMPMEQVWTWLKYDRLCNFPPRDAHHLNEAVIRELDVIRDDQHRLRNFFHASRLPLPRALLS